RWAAADRQFVECPPEPLRRRDEPPGNPARPGARCNDAAADTRSSPARFADLSDLSGYPGVERGTWRHAAPKGARAPRSAQSPLVEGLSRGPIWTGPQRYPDHG